MVIVINKANPKLLLGKMDMVESVNCGLYVVRRLRAIITRQLALMDSYYTETIVFTYHPRIKSFMITRTYYVFGTIICEKL